MSWSTGTAAITDIRTALSDGPTDRFCWRKKCLGVIDGTNKTFKTFEKRRLSPLVGPTAPAGVYVNDVAATASAEDLGSGEFTLAAAPQEGDRIEASYYAQWWLDTQITTFLASATQFLGLGTDPTLIPDGLIPAATKYACADAYQELAIRFASMTSEQYRMEDLPKEALKATIEGYSKMADQYRKEAMNLRKDYYTRQNESDSPIFDSICGDVHEVEPNA